MYEVAVIDAPPGQTVETAVNHQPIEAEMQHWANAEGIHAAANGVGPLVHGLELLGIAAIGVGITRWLINRRRNKT